MSTSKRRPLRGRMPRQFPGGPARSRRDYPSSGLQDRRIWTVVARQSRAYPESMAVDAAWLTNHIRDIPDYPQAGVTFRDLTPLMGDAEAFRFAIDAIADHFAGVPVDRVLGIEARGFIVGAPVAYRMGASFVPARKGGKLPWAVAREEFV